MFPLPFPAELAAVPKLVNSTTLPCCHPLYMGPRVVLGTGDDVLSEACVPWGPCNYVSGIWCCHHREAPGTRHVCASSPAPCTRPFSDPSEDRHDAGHPLVWGIQDGPPSPGGAEGTAASWGPGVLAQQLWEGQAHTPRCITRRECMCSTALHSCTKYFHTVLSGMSRFCFLKYCGGGDRQTDGRA